MSDKAVQAELLLDIQLFCWFCHALAQIFIDLSQETDHSSNMICNMTFEPPHDKTNKPTFASSKDSDQPGHPPI